MAIRFRRVSRLCDPTNKEAGKKEYHYLPEEALCYIAKELKMSEAKI